MRAGTVLAILLLLPSCGVEKVPSAAVAVENAVRRYNRCLIEAYQAADAGLVESAASEAEVGRVGIIIGALSANGEIIRAGLTRLEFRTVLLVSDSRAEAKTTEDWVYENVSLKTWEVTKTARNIQYKLHYLLKMQAGRWIVVSIAVE